MDDKRFAHIAKDPKFRRLPKSRQKIVIDKRFQSMFDDKKFDSSHKIDKRGRPINYKTNTNLKQFYELASGDEEQEDVNNTKSSEEEEEEVDDNDLKTVTKHDEHLSEEIKKKLRNMDIDYARGKSRLISESSSSDDDEDETEIEDEIDKIEHNWGELDRDAETTDETTYRLAACNMDWDRIRAIDLMVLFNSFLPQNGVIKSVAIYPSEFGKQRMREEEIKGPIELVENNSDNDKDNDDDDDNEEGSKYHMEKLRQYQLNRLKYYYAVITFDSVQSANRIYNECDGMEYESTATKLDLRFIPDDMIFDDEPKEFCDKLPELNKYQPRFFTTTALQQAKVDLTWDETDLQRIEIVKKFNSGKIDEINDEDLKNYIASSSGDDNSDNDSEGNDDDDNDSKTTDKDSIEKYRKLLQQIEKHDDDDEENEEGGMEMKWDLNLQEKTDKIVKQKQEDNDDEDKTPFQKYLDKRKEKRKEKKSKKHQNDEDSDVPSDIDLNDPYFAEEFDKDEFKKKSTKKPKNNNKEDENEKNAELELLLMNEDDDDDDKHHFSLKKIQDHENTSKNKKNKKKRKDDNDSGNNKIQDDFEINVNDDRFSALFTNHLYNIDQTDPHYKKTKATETLISEKLKRRMLQEPIADDENTKTLKTDSELNMLVRSIKRKKHK